MRNKMCQPEMMPYSVEAPLPISQVQERYCERRITHLFGEVTMESCFMLNYYLERIVTSDSDRGIAPEDAEPITIRVNSPGGALYGIISVIAYVEHLKKIGYTIITEGSGECCSAGFFMMVFGSKGYRKSFKYTEFMMHQQSFGLSVTNVIGIERKTEQVKKIWDMLAKMISDNTKISTAKLNKMKNASLDWFMTPEEALKLGVIDEII